MRSVVASLGDDGRGVLQELRGEAGGVSGAATAAEYTGTAGAGGENGMQWSADDVRRGCTMSAMVVVLPVVFGAAEERTRTRPEERGSVLTMEAGARLPVSRFAGRPELAFYRKYTEGMLRRYLRLSMEKGRVPSLLGQEMFRGRVTTYKIRSFEDVVIFVHDVEMCLKRLTETEQDLLERIAIQEYTQGEAAGLLGMSLRTVVRKYAAAVDELTGHFLETGLLEPLMACQEEEGCDDC